jgi:hypothetical protein
LPWIIDYETVLERLKGDGLKCSYFNGGAFGFPAEAGAQVRGWIGPADETIKPGVRGLARSVPEPYESNLADLAARVWQTNLAGNVWLMPASHWSFELNFGSREWMPALIENIDLDPGLLAGRTNAAAIEFSPEEVDPFRHFTQRLLEMLHSSDFFLAFPRRGTICNLHHHKQLWWVTIDSTVMSALDALVPADARK